MILVAYASAHGSTAGIAAHMAVRLQNAGLPSVAAPVHTLGSIASYDAAIVGSAIHNGAWLPEAAAFLEGHRTQLQRVPCWLFSVGAVGERSSFFGAGPSRIIRDAQEVRSHTAQLVAATGARGHHGFAGAVDPKDWSALGNVFLRALGGRPGDHRDWPEIDEWTDSVVAALRGIAMQPHAA